MDSRVRSASRKATKILIDAGLRWSKAIRDACRACLWRANLVNFDLKHHGHEPASDRPNKNNQAFSQKAYAKLECSCYRSLFGTGNNGPVKTAIRVVFGQWC